MFKGSNVALITPFKNNKLDVDNYIELIHFHIKIKFKQYFFFIIIL